MERESKDRLAAGYALAVLCSLLSAAMIVLIKWAAADVPLIKLVFLTQLVAAITWSVLIPPRRLWAEVPRIPAAGWAWMAVIVVLTFFAYWTFFMAIARLDPAVASFVNRTETLITLFLGILLYRERMDGREWIGALFVLAGVLVIRFTAEVAVGRGLMICLFSAVLWGVAEALAKKALAYIRPSLFTWIRSMALILPFFFTLLALGETPWLPLEVSPWLGVLAISLTGPVLARYVYLKSLTVIPVSKCALINQIQPVWVAVIACVTLGTLPTLQEWVGGLLIMAGCMFLLKIKVRVAARKPSPAQPARLE